MSTAKGISVHRCDSGFTVVGDPLEESLQHRAQTVDGGTHRQFVDVCTSDECLVASPSEHDDVDRVIITDVIEVSVQLLLNVAVEGIMLVGTINGEGGNPVYVVTEDQLILWGHEV